LQRNLRIWPRKSSLRNRSAGIKDYVVDSPTSEVLRTHV
jgi:hypothetical protein